MTWTLLPIIAIVFLASFIRSAFGFGEALVSVPLLALLIPVTVAVPLAVLVSITIAAVVVVQDWREIHLGSAVRLILPTLLGTPLGLLLLIVLDAAIVKAILAAVMISFSTYSLMGRRPVFLPDDRLAWAFGFGAGVLGGAYGMNGPPLVIYGACRGWTPQRFRATLQGYFLPASVMAMAGYWFVDLWTPEVTRAYLLTLPAVIAAIAFGRIVNRSLSASSFLRAVHVGLIVVGGLLLAQAVS